MISIDWVFLVVVGESGCWLAGCGVIYSANELPLVLLNSGETSFTWYWSAYFSVGSGSLVNIKLIKIWQTFFYFTLQALLHKRENCLSQSITYHKLPRLHWQATSRYWRYRGVNIAKKKEEEETGFSVVFLPDFNVRANWVKKGCRKDYAREMVLLFSDRNQASKAKINWNHWQPYLFR